MAPLIISEMMLNQAPMKTPPGLAGNLLLRKRQPLLEIECKLSGRYKLARGGRE